MAKRGKYGAEKRQKEIKRKKKQEAKLERKRLKKQGDADVELEPGSEELPEAGIEDADAVEAD